MAHVALTALKLNIMVSSLERGHHIACKDLDELLAAEDAFYTARTSSSTSILPARSTAGR
jgi:hypothetical protein